METEYIRALLFEWLRNWKPNDPLEFDRCVREIAYRSEEKNPGILEDSLRGRTLNTPARQALLQIIWELIMDRAMIPAGGRDAGWPTLTITDHGRKVFATTGLTPYDPDNYLARMASASPNLSATVIRYVAEAIATYRSGSVLASTVMIGAAAEMLIVDLARSLPSKLTEKQKLAKQIKAIGEWCTRHRKYLPSPWDTEEHASDFLQLATFIRRSRNEAGHPTDPPADISNEQMHAALLVFPGYCKQVCTLKAWADANPGTVAGLN